MTKDRLLAYEIDAECTNCGFAGRVEIRKGIQIRQKSCPTCGCAALRRKGTW